MKLPDLTNVFFPANPGDKISLEVTKTRRRVGKIRFGESGITYSKTIYPNGTVVETLTRKPQD